MAEKIVQTAGREALGEFAPEFAHYNDDVLFGENWNNQDIDVKTRCIITVTALIASGMTDSSLKFHIINAKNNGVTQKEMAAVITHIAFYAGWPKAWAAFNLAKEVYAQDAAKYLGVPIVRIDEEMCREAVRRGNRIGVMATLPTTMNPTCNTVRRMARECGKHVEITECLVEGAFGLDQEQFRSRMEECAGSIADAVDVIVFAQGSMAYCEQYIANRYHKIVLSSPRFGAAALRRALEDKGCISRKN